MVDKLPPFFYDVFFKGHMDVSKNSDTPKWMVYNGKTYEQMDDLGVPLFLETPIWQNPVDLSAV